MNTFETFNNGKLVTPAATKDFSVIPWREHPNFTGVELKHIHETQLETHEVIAGNGTCINEGTAITYEPGVISVFPAGIPHEVTADEDGLYLFAKFMPALC